eukprot:TRINITY_DN35633_c0_g1_i2.p1 TRINITY_DN35633_c0_g1~~TRINITY_DN35633_c0_g1_i2.p1  ORF type:complete len:314 (+),score=51.99 TRINITY_DN35633_c0_g1_i2:29-970(+)
MAAPAKPAKTKITVVGAANYDLISYVPRLPTIGETLHGHKFHMGCGGKGANQAVMAAKLGGDVVMLTKLGKDVFGEDTLRNFKQWNVNTDHVSFTDKAFSGVAPIAVDSEGRNSIIIVTGANDLITEEDIEAARPVIRDSHVLVCQLEIPVAITLKALRVAREEGVTTIFNPAPARADLPDEIYKLSDIICPNEPEAQMLTGLPVATQAEAEAAARVLLSRGAGKVIMTLGERGSLLVTPDHAELVPSIPVKAIDTTGAGDSFVGSLVYFMARGFDLPTAMRRANHIAGISVTAHGTQTSFPTAAQVPADVLN